MGKEKELRNDRDLDARQSTEAEPSSTTAPANANQQSAAWLTADKSADRKPDESKQTDAMTMLREFAGLRHLGKATPENSLHLIKAVAVGHTLHDLATQLAQIETFVRNGTLGPKFRVDQAVPALQSLEPDVASIYSTLLKQRVGVDLPAAVKELQKTALVETKHDALAAIARSYRAAGTANAKPAVDALVELRKAGLGVMEIERLIRGTDETIPLTEAELMVALTADQQQAYALSAAALKQPNTTERKQQTTTTKVNTANAGAKSQGSTKSDKYGPFKFDPSMLAGATPETAKLVIGATLIMGAAQQYNLEHKDAPITMPATVAQFYAMTDLRLSVGDRELTSEEVWDAVHQEGGWDCTLTRDYFDNTILPSAKDPKAFDVAMLDEQIGNLQSQIEMASLEQCTVSSSTVPGILDTSRESSLLDFRKLRVSALQARLTEFKKLRDRVSNGETTLSAERERLHRLAEQAREEAAALEAESQKARVKYNNWKEKSQYLLPKERAGIAISEGESTATLEDYGRKASEMKTFADGKSKFADELDAMASNPFSIVTPNVISQVEKQNSRKFEFVSTDAAFMRAVAAGAEDTGAFFLRVGAGVVQLNGMTPTGMISNMPLPGYTESLGGMIQNGLRGAATVLEEDANKNTQIAASVLGEFGATLIRIGSGALIQTALTAGAGGLIGLLGRGAVAATSTTMRVAQTVGTGATLNVLANLDKDGGTIAKSAITGGLPGGAAGFKSLLPKLVYTFFAAGMSEVVQSSDFTAGYKIMTDGGGGSKAAAATFANVDINRVAANSLVSVAGELAQHHQEPTQATETVAAQRHFVAEVDGVQTYYRTLPDGTLESLGNTKVPNAARLTKDELAATQGDPTQREAALFTAENRAIEKETQVSSLQGKQRDVRARVMEAIEAEGPIAAKDLADSKLAAPAGYRKSENGETWTYDATKALADRQTQQQQAAATIAALSQHVTSLREINAETAQLQAAIKKPGTPKAEIERMTARLDELATKAATSKVNLVESQQAPGETVTPKQVEETPTKAVDEDESTTVATTSKDAPTGIVSKGEFGDDMRRLFPKLATDDVKGQQYIDAQWKTRMKSGDKPAAQVEKAIAPSEKPMSADEILAQSSKNELDNEQRDAMISRASQNKTPAQSLPEVSYTTIDATVLQAIMDKGLLAGKALGKQGANADAIWFKQGAPFYGEGITLAIPTKRLLELGGIQDFGLAGQENIIKVPFDKAPTGIPFSEFAVVSSIGQNFVEPIYTPKGWKGPLGVGFDEKTNAGAVLGTKPTDGEVSPAVKSESEPATKRVDEAPTTKPTEDPTTLSKPPVDPVKAPTSTSDTTVATPKPTIADASSPIPKPTTPLVETDALPAAQELDKIAADAEKQSHNEGRGSIGSCTWAANLAAIAAERRGWSAEIVVINGKAYSSSTDASLGTTGSGAAAATEPFGHAMAKVTLPDGSTRIISWGKTFASVDAAVASNPSIVPGSVKVIGTFTQYEQTMRLLNQNGYVRPAIPKELAQAYSTNNMPLDAAPKFTEQSHPWNFHELEVEDAKQLTEDAATKGLSNPTNIEIEAFSPAGEGFSKFLDKLRVNGVEQSFQNRGITTRFKTTIVEVTNSSNMKVYGVRTPTGELRYWPTLEQAIKASRLGDRTWWRADQVTQGSITDGTIEAYKQYQKEANTPSTQKQQE